MLKQDYFERAFWYALVEKYKHMGWKVSINMFYRFAVVAINLVTGIIMSRDLMEANRGLFQLFITSLIWFNTFLNLGLNSSATYYANKSPDKIKLYLSTNLIVSIGSAVIIGFVFYFYGLKFNFQSNALKYIFIVCYLIYSYSLIFRSFLLGLNQFEYSQRIDFITRIVYLLYIVVLHYLGCMTVLNIVMFMVIEYLAFSIISYRKVNIQILPLEWNLDFLKESFLFNSKIYINSVLVVILLRSDQYIIKSFMGNYHVGIYSIGSLVLENMCMFATTITIFYLPKLFASEDLDIILEKSKRVLLLILSSSIVLSIVMFFLAPYVVMLYFKHENIVASDSLRILLIGFISWTIYIFINSVYFTIRFKKSNLIILFICLSLNVISNLYFVPKYGVIAAAWSSSICYTILAVLSYIDLFVLKKNNFLKKQQNGSN